MKKIYAIAAAVLVVATTPAASKDQLTVSVDVSDLDLTQNADQDKLERRIDNAARRICRTGAFDTGARRAENECRLAIIENAAAQVKLAIAKARDERFATISLDIQG